MQHFHIIAAIPRALPQAPHGEQSSRETEQQILEDALLAHFVKRRKVKKKWLKKFWVIIFYITMSCMVFSLFNEWMVYWMVLSTIDWMNGLVNDFKNDLMKASFSYWVKEIALNCYFHVDELGLGNWEWCEAGEGP